MYEYIYLLVDANNLILLNFIRVLTIKIIYIPWYLSTVPLGTNPTPTHFHTDLQPVPVFFSTGFQRLPQLSIPSSSLPVSNDFTIFPSPNGDSPQHFSCNSDRPNPSQRTATAPSSGVQIHPSEQRFPATSRNSASPAFHPSEQRFPTGMFPLSILLNFFFFIYCNTNFLAVRFFCCAIPQEHLCVLFSILFKIFLSLEFQFDSSLAVQFLDLYDFHFNNSIHLFRMHISCLMKCMNQKKNQKLSFSTAILHC